MQAGRLDVAVHILTRKVAVRALIIGYGVFILRVLGNIGRIAGDGIGRNGIPAGERPARFGGDRRGVRRVVAVVQAGRLDVAVRILTRKVAVRALIIGYGVLDGCGGEYRIQICIGCDREGASTLINDIAVRAGGPAGKRVGVGVIRSLYQIAGVAENGNRVVKRIRIVGIDRNRAARRTVRMIGHGIGLQQVRAGHGGIRCDRAGLRGPCGLRAVADRGRLGYGVVRTDGNVLNHGRLTVLEDDVSVLGGIDGVAAGDGITAVIEHRVIAGSESYLEGEFVVRIAVVPAAVHRFGDREVGAVSLIGKADDTSTGQRAVFRSGAFLHRTVVERIVGVGGRGITGLLFGRKNFLYHKVFIRVKTLILVERRDLTRLEGDRAVRGNNLIFRTVEAVHEGIGLARHSGIAAVIGELEFKRFVFIRKEGVQPGDVLADRGHAVDGQQIELHVAVGVAVAALEIDNRHRMSRIFRKGLGHIEIAADAEVRGIRARAGEKVPHDGAFCVPGLVVDALVRGNAVGQVDRAGFRAVDAAEVQHKLAVDIDPEVVVAGEGEHHILPVDLPSLRDDKACGQHQAERIIVAVADLHIVKGEELFFLVALEHNEVVLRRNIRDMLAAGRAVEGILAGRRIVFKGEIDGIDVLGTVAVHRLADGRGGEQVGRRVAEGGHTRSAVERTPEDTLICSPNTAVTAVVQSRRIAAAAELKAGIAEAAGGARRIVDRVLHAALRIVKQRRGQGLGVNRRTRIDKVRIDGCIFRNYGISAEVCAAVAVRGPAEEGTAGGRSRSSGHVVRADRRSHRHSLGRDRGAAVFKGNGHIAGRGRLFDVDRQSTVTAVVAAAESDLAAVGEASAVQRHRCDTVAGLCGHRYIAGICVLPYAVIAGGAASVRGRAVDHNGQRSDLPPLRTIAVVRGRNRHISAAAAAEGNVCRQCRHRQKRHDHRQRKQGTEKSLFRHSISSFFSSAGASSQPSKSLPTQPTASSISLTSSSILRKRRVFFSSIQSTVPCHVAFCRNCTCTTKVAFSPLSEFLKSVSIFASLSRVSDAAFFCFPENVRGSNVFCGKEIRSNDASIRPNNSIQPEKFPFFSSTGPYSRPDISPSPARSTQTTVGSPRQCGKLCAAVCMRHSPFLPTHLFSVCRAYDAFILTHSGHKTVRKCHLVEKKKLIF